VNAGSRVGQLGASSSNWLPTSFFDDAPPSERRSECDIGAIG
jgi:hypothetical protein